ncbi:hypothetical protein [Algoriphagus iocasae]|uniref:hypothetical protein n=1 Tax=Algoriphagus iocasae TaxID=1836499 RepID=UPI0016102860|nr:hypothetical protein [Algoriphagus iocasae]
MKFHRGASSHLRVENKTIFYPVWKSKLFLFQVGHYVHTMLWHHILQLQGHIDLKKNLF